MPPDDSSVKSTGFNRPLQSAAVSAEGFGADRHKHEEDDDDDVTRRQQGMLLGLTSLAVLLLVLILCAVLWHVANTSAKQAPLAPPRSSRSSFQMDDGDDETLEDREILGLQSKVI